MSGNSGGQPIDHHVPAGLLDTLRIIVIGRQRVPVSNEEQTGVFPLQLDPVLQHAVVVAKMERTGGAHAGKDSFCEHDF